ncbi:hypothetical protein BCR33DRAFT_716865 [Rhizoclosmatium globosum]|uniref:Sister chromatid cohesion protein n=1 Tax=Rhizoclosmatium globosum TaxID=329046 RepID=A0A1Y2CB62_9FUNG|nr:hypothetical protein BCR33DRAFT_716865 [Rhizoclosmatium globosum]|eukprot:ORY44291.1 hypothetical protein BCR33DRAFT_716865 [Rhizoclosmatium globosum]
MDSQNTQSLPRNSLAQKSLDFCIKNFMEPQKPKVPNFTSAVEWLENLDSSMLTPLQKQMDLQMLSLFPAPVPPQHPESPPKRSRSSISTDAKTPASALDSQASAPVTPVSRKHSQPSQRVNSSSAIPSSSTRHPTPRRATSLNSIVSTPAVEDDLRDVEVELRDGTWKNVLAKCVDATTSLLKADDLIQSGEIDSSPLIDPDTKLPVLAALDAIHRPFRRLVDMKKISEFVDAIEEEEGDGWIKRVVRVCEKVLTGCECIHLFVTKKESGGEDEDQANQDEDEKDDDDVDKLLHSSTLGLESASLLVSLLTHLGPTTNRHGETNNKTRPNLTLLTLLFSHAQFTDSLIITTYVSLIPLFFTEPSTTVTSIGLEKLQTTCLHLLCTLFSRNPGHRVPMMEEIAGYCRKSASVARTYKLRSSINASGKNIQMVSALVVSLIQSTFCGVDVLDCVHEVRDAVKAGRNEDGDERIGVERLVGVAKQGLDSSQACGLFFFKYLIGRAFVEGKSAVSTPGKRGGGGLVGGGVETELRSVLENLVEDLVVLLGEPEWPGADFLVLLFCKMMTQALDDTKKNQDIPIKSLGLDFLGQLTSRLFSLTNVKCLGSKVEGLMDTKELETFANSLQGPIASESGGASMGKLSGLWEVQSFVVEYLKEERENDGGYDGARTFHVFNWIHTLSNTFTTISTQKEPLASTLRTLLLYYYRLPHTLLSKQSLPTDTLDPTTTLKLSAWCLLRRSHLYTLRENLLHYILASVDSETITLSDVVSVDASVLSLGSVKSVISNRLLDPSKSVRDAAVELVGGYLMREWNERLVEEYYPILVPRMLDRVLKLMKEVVAGAMAQEVSEESEMSRSMSEKCVEVVVKLMGRVGDEETAVQDLAVKCLAEIWFSPFKTLSGSQGGGSGGSGKQAVDDSVESVVASLSKRSLAYVDQSVQGKFEIKSRTSFGVGNSVGAVDAIGDVIKKLLETNVVKNRDVVVVSRSLVECLTEGILVAEKNHEKDVIKTSLMLLNQISRVLPQLLLPHVKMLHMYLKGTGLPNNQADRAAMLNEERITAAVVSILGVVIPHTKDPDLSLMDAIEGDLLVLLSKRTLPVVNLIVPCLATIVHQVTKNYAKLTKVLKTCLDNFQKSRQMINSTDFASYRIDQIFVEFLKTEQIRMMQEELAKVSTLFQAANVNTKTVDIKVLIGNADEMADAGVSSAVMQMYLNYILEGLMSVDVTLSTTAFDAVCIIIEQGLAHPLLCVPFVIAMQTSVIPSVRDRAIIIYDNLAEKHQRYTIESHESEEDGVNGPLAFKRPRRNEFLMTLVRSFDVDVNLSKICGGKLGTLNYKSADEVLNIIYHICQVLSVSGETVLKAIEDLKKTDSQDEKVLAATAKSSILMGMLVKLKTFFQKLYDLSESKCRRFAPSESSRNTEKSRPATRQQSASSVIDWSSWPILTTDIVNYLEGTQELSVSTGSSAPSKKPRRSSLKGSGSSRAPSRVAFDADSVLDSPSASERPKRSMSRASVVDLSSDE